MCHVVQLAVEDTKTHFLARVVFLAHVSLFEQRSNSLRNERRVRNTYVIYKYIDVCARFVFFMPRDLFSHSDEPIGKIHVYVRFDREKRETSWWWPVSAPRAEGKSRMHCSTGARSCARYILARFCAAVLPRLRALGGTRSRTPRRHLLHYITLH